MSSRALLSRYGLAAFILLGGTAFSVASFVALRGIEREFVATQYEERAVNALSVVRSQLEASVEVVRSVASLYQSSDEVTREEFHTFTERFLKTRTGIQALEWLPRVPARERATLEQRMRAGGYIDFEITESAPEGTLARAGERDEYFPVLYLEPFEGNGVALGYDVGSEPTRLAAMTQARDSGSTRATAMLSLVQGKGREAGMLVFEPVYHRGWGAYRDDVAERQARLAGFATGVFNLRDLVRTALQRNLWDERRSRSIDFYLFDGREWDGRRVLVFARTSDPYAPTGPLAAANAPPATPHLTETFELAGRHFTSAAMLSDSTPSPLLSWLPVIALLVGAGFTAAVFGNLLVSAGRAEDMRQLVDQRTEEVKAVRAELRSRVAGHEAAEATVRELTKITRYLSPQVSASAAAGQIVSHRRKLSVVFCDIANFTEAVEQLESEDVTQVLNQYLTEMSRIGLEHGATIDKYIGDGIMMFFGDPETHGVKADALACVRMALVMREHMNGLRREWGALGFRHPPQCRIGVSTGYCTVGNFGSEAMMNYTIVGSGVNLAARLQAAAVPGSILIAEETWALVKDHVQCQEHPPLEVKGIPGRVVAYRVVGLREDAEEGGGVVREALPALRLDLDLRGMSPDERERATAALQRALRLLAPEEGEPGTGSEDQA